MAKTHKQSASIDIMRRPIPVPEAKKALKEQLSSTNTKSPVSYTMDTLLQLGVVYMDIGQIADGMACCDKCETYIAQYGSTAQKALALFLRGRILSFEHQYEQSMAIALRSLHLFMQTDVYEYQAKCYVLCGIQCRNLSMYSEGIEYLILAVEVAKQSGNKGLTAMCMQNLNELKSDLLPTEMAIQSFNDFVKYLNTVYIGKASHTEANVLLCLSELYLRAKDLPKAKEVFQKAILIKNELGSNARAIDYINREAEIAAFEGDEKQMLELTEKAINLSKEHKTHQTERWANVIRFDFYMDRSKYSKAKKYLDIVKVLVTENQTARNTALLHPLYIKYYHATGNMEKEMQYMTELHKYEIEIQQQITLQRLKHATAVHELEMKEKENEIMKRELSLKSQELNLTNHYLQQRNELLSEMKESIMTLKQENTKRGIVFQTLFHKIDMALVREENEKDLFKAKFDTSNMDFIRTLSCHWPALSPSECRICGLLHSGFNTKEIATLLSTTLRNVETQRLNIRKKMKLNRKDNLQLVLAALRDK